MEDILLVDGYNIINAWPDLRDIATEDLEHARYELIDILQDYQGYKGCRIIIVFDAHMIKGGIEKKEMFGSLEVIYTRENETADHYIERFTDMTDRHVRVAVATSDSLQQTIVLSRGAVRLSARELLEQVNQSRKEIGQQYLDNPKPRPNRLGDWASPDIVRVLERWRRQR